jgi:hypothetical protein
MTEPSFSGLPLILGTPQVGFSSAKRRMSARISAVAFGLPARARDCRFQKPVQQIQPRERPFPLEKDELLPQGRNLLNSLLI